ncbi:MAG: hypothetical protein VX394_02095, partial [Pseudomonadota bacterium]|nr:hypothetical protein [Pseudomonadota bacterium]
MVEPLTTGGRARRYGIQARVQARRISYSYVQDRQMKMIIDSGGIAPQTDFKTTHSNQAIPG